MASFVITINQSINQSVSISKFPVTKHKSCSSTSQQQLYIVIIVSTFYCTKSFTPINCQYSTMYDLLISPNVHRGSRYFVLAMTVDL